MLSAFSSVSATGSVSLSSLVLPLAEAVLVSSSVLLLAALAYS
jgi:hypothetical protein